jgi:threonine synthase
MNNVTHLHCLLCGREYQPGEVDYVCPEHGNEGILDVRYDYEWIGSEISPDSLRDDHTPDHMALPAAAANCS